MVAAVRGPGGSAMDSVSEEPAPRAPVVSSSAASSPRRERRGAPARRAAPRRGPGGLLVLAAAGAGAAALWAAVRRRGAHRARAARLSRIEAGLLKGVVVHTGFKRDHLGAGLSKRRAAGASFRGGASGEAEGAGCVERAVVSTSLARRLADGSALLHPAAGSVSERFPEEPALARFDATTPWRERVPGARGGGGSGGGDGGSLGRSSSKASSGGASGSAFVAAGPETAVARAVAERFGEVGVGAETAGSPGLAAAQAVGLAYARVPLSAGRGDASGAPPGAPRAAFVLARDASRLPTTVGAVVAGDAVEGLFRAATQANGERTAAPAAEATKASGEPTEGSGASVAEGVGESGAEASAKTKSSVALPSLSLPPLPSPARAPSSLVTYLVATDVFHALGGGARESELRTLAAVMAWAGREMTKTIALTDFLHAHVTGIKDVTRDLAVERIRAQMDLEASVGRANEEKRKGQDGEQGGEQRTPAALAAPRTGLAPGDLAPTSGPPLRGAAPSRATPTEVLLTLLALRQAALAQAKEAFEEGRQDEDETSSTPFSSHGDDAGKGSANAARPNRAGAAEEAVNGEGSDASTAPSAGASPSPWSPLWRPSEALQTRLAAVAVNAKTVLSKALSEGHVIVLPGAPGNAPLEGFRDASQDASEDDAPDKADASSSHPSSSSSVSSPPFCSLSRHVRYGQALGALAAVSDAAAVALPGLPEGSPGPILLAAPARLFELCRAASKLAANLRAVEDLELPKPKDAHTAETNAESGDDGQGGGPAATTTSPAAAARGSAFSAPSAGPSSGPSTSTAAVAAAEVLARSGGGSAARAGMVDRDRDAGEAVPGRGGTGAASSAAFAPSSSSSSSSSPASALRLEGNALFKAGDAAGAELAYSRALELEPSSAVLFSNRALVRLQLGRFSDAVADCDAAIQVQVTPKALLRRAAGLRALGDVETATQDLKRVLAIEPKNAQAKRELRELKAVAGVSLAL